MPMGCSSVGDSSVLVINFDAESFRKTEGLGIVMSASYARLLTSAFNVR